MTLDYKINNSIVHRASDVGKGGNVQFATINRSCPHDRSFFYCVRTLPREYTQHEPEFSLPISALHSHHS